MLGVRPSAAMAVPLASRSAAASCARTAAAAGERQALREALAGLAVPDLQQQSVFAVEALLAGSDAPLTDLLVREALRLADLAAAPAAARRLRYRWGRAPAWCCMQRRTAVLCNQVEPPCPPQAGSRGAARPPSRRRLGQHAAAGQRPPS